MHDVVIRVEKLSKQYRLGQVGRKALSHDINRWWHRIRGKKDPYLKIGNEDRKALNGNNEYVWALHDINFEVRSGEVLGIIGKNGAGKSTLLKILSKVTSPTAGIIKTKGRIASLLEVGTGFHPELTGRQNIFLNGAILGMTKKEIEKKFDEIVDFSGVELYIDTPVKRYSSGMYVRLAFAVAAHLDPEILIVDEVLAVGDAEFQKKCLGRMKDVSEREGRTVLFVSHNVGAIQNLCTIGLFLCNGKLEYSGMIGDVLSSYLSSMNERSFLYEKNYSSSDIYISRIEIRNTYNISTPEFGYEEDIYVNCSIVSNVNISGDCRLLIIVQDRFQKKIFASEKKITKTGKYILKIEGGFLTRGNYSLNCIIYTPAIAQFDNIHECCHFRIVDTGSAWSHLETFDYGVVFAKAEWIK